ncbi:GNAT family N-acetyltransferase [Beduini massiliensis]|uniref:GNAT family N-acetyltransferase n=1 Tax=Beduini massiliensis TaxID=1585974 RepID=UPI00059A981A|nr:GNAT family protein [Beduini massiliensis]
MKHLDTKRLVLRDWEQTDLEDFFAYASKPSIGPAAGWPPHTCITTSQKILDSFIKSQEVWAITDKLSQRVIGSLGLHPDEHRKNPNCRMIGYVLDDLYWGKGLMKEAVEAVLDYAFNDLALDLISVYHYPFNHQSKRVIEKCGFTYEGTMRRALIHFDKGVTDSCCYSMTKEEYVHKKRS